MPEPDAVPSKRILVVEDDETCRNTILRMMAEAPDLAADGVGSAEEARERLEAENFTRDLCLIDDGLPGISGSDFLTWLRTVAPRVAAVMVTGCRDESFLFRCLEQGALDYVEKPVGEETLLGVVRNALARQEKILQADGGIRAEIQTRGWVELTAPSEMEYLSRLQRFTDVLFASRLPKEICEDLRLIVEEIGRNAIEWGNKFDSEKEFRMSYCIFRDRIVFKFEDEGEGFHPETIRDPTADPRAHIQKRKDEGKRPGGFGIYLVQKLMDEVVYNERGNSVVMTKFF